MKTILIVSGVTEIDRLIKQYVENSQLPNYNYVFLMEFFSEGALPPSLPKNVYGVRDFSQGSTLESVIQAILNENEISQVISVDEYSVHIAAKIRRKIGLKGLQPDQAIKFRDKLAMKQALAATSIRVPRVFSSQEILSQQVVFPLVAKPRSLAGSLGVKVIHTADQLTDLLGTLSKDSFSEEHSFVDMSEQQYQFEEYIQGRLFHIDGLVHDSKVLFFKVAEYLGTPLSFLHGEPLGSITLENSEEWRDFLDQVVKGLSVPDGAFHLESFKNDRNEPIFLEIAVRMGGGPIYKTSLEVYGIDLLLSHLQLQMGVTIDYSSTLGKHDQKTSAGWVIFPKDYKGQNKKRVTSVELPKEGYLSKLFYSEIPRSGHSASGVFSNHCDNLGTFAFQGERSQVLEDIQLMLKGYKVSCDEGECQ